MRYTSNLLVNLKNTPTRSPLASVRDHSPPTIWWEVVTKRGDRVGVGRSKYGNNNYYIYLKRKKQNENTAEKSLKLIYGLAALNELGAKPKVFQDSLCNDFLPLYFRSDLTSATELLRVSKFIKWAIEFNCNINNLTRGG